MGLTIHYTLDAGTRPLPEIRQLVGALRAQAATLPFASVREIVELAGKECRFVRGKQDPHAWLKIQTQRYPELKVEGGAVGATVHPTHIIAFSIQPSDGCEQANFGYCRYPSTVDIRGRRIRTGQKGWSWSSFCKTQYSSNPTLGGMENFLKAHLGIVRLLDYAKELKILGEVKDEGGYWEGRSVTALVQEVGEWNKMIAAGYGVMRDAVEATGGDIRQLHSEIAKFSDFEHLEAKGREKGASE